MGDFNYTLQYAQYYMGDFNYTLQYAQYYGWL